MLSEKELLCSQMQLPTSFLTMAITLTNKLNQLRIFVVLTKRQICIGLMLQRQVDLLNYRELLFLQKHSIDCIFDRPFSNQAMIKSFSCSWRLITFNSSATYFTDSVRIFFLSSTVILLSGQCTFACGLRCRSSLESISSRFTRFYSSSPVHVAL